MAEPMQRIILDGVEFSKVFHGHKLLGSCTAALQPGRMVIALLMVTLVVTFGRIWDAVAAPTVAPAGLGAGRWSPDDAAGHQGSLRQAMMRFALDSDRPADGEAWPTLHPARVLEQIHTGYRMRRGTGGEDVAAIDAEFRETARWIRERSPLGTYEATAARVRGGFAVMIRGAMALSPPAVLDGLSALVVRLPLDLWRHDRVFTLVLGLVALLAYVVGGGALARMAACQFASGLRLGMDEAIDFALVHWIRLGIAVMLPVLTAALLAGVIAAMGALMLAPILDVLGGFLYGLALLLGFVLAFVIVGYAAGFGMVLPAVACENCDGADAMQKAYAYVYQRPLHLLGYLVVAFVGLVLGYLVVSLFAAVMLGSTAMLFGWSGHAALDTAADLSWLNLELRETEPWNESLGADLVVFWQSLVITLVAAFVISHLCDVFTRLFMLMRRTCDDQAIEEIWWQSMTPGTIAARAPDDAEAP